MCWRFEAKEGSKKPLKVPYYFNGSRRTGQNGSETDRAQLTDFDTALAAAIKCNYTGIGFAPLPEFNITILDFDLGLGDQLPADVMNMLIGTYSEYSPSGNGVHAFYQGDLGNRKAHSSEETFGFETFSSKGYVTFTGNQTLICEVADCTNTITEPPEDILRLCVDRFGSALCPKDIEKVSSTPVGLSDAELMHCLAIIPPDLNYDQWLRVGMAIHYETQGKGFDLWDKWSSEAPDKYSGTEFNELKWASFGRYSENMVTAHTLVSMAQHYGSDISLYVAKDEDFSKIEDTLEHGYFHIRSAADFILNTKKTEWLIKNILPKANLGILYGESGSGKSFIALDLCIALASNTQTWNTFKVFPGKVLYVIAEGVGGFPNRLKAYCMAKDIDIKDIHLDVISDVAPNLTNPKSVNHLIKDISDREKYDLIVMDTFAQVTSGANENSGEEMGKALSYCKTISQISGALVLLVHHSGKDNTKGARGWSGIHAAADIVIEVTRFEDDRMLKITKQKDGVDGYELGFNLISMVLDHDEDGDTITSCTVEYQENGTRRVKKRLLQNVQRMIYKVVSEAEIALSKEQVVAEVVALLPENEGPRDTRQQRIKRAISTLLGTYLDEDDQGKLVVKE